MPRTLAPLLRSRTVPTKQQTAPTRASPARRRAISAETSKSSVWIEMLLDMREPPFCYIDRLLYRSPRMVTQAFAAHGYTLYLSPQSPHREVFAFRLFVPHPYALIDLPGFGLAGRTSLFAAHRTSDGKMGQLVSFELEADRLRFEQRFTPD